MKHKMFRIIALLSTMAMMMLAFAGCGGNAENKDVAQKSAGTSNPNAIVVKYSVTFASSGVQADGAKELAKMISDESDGKLKMEFYPSSQLGDKQATFEGLQSGTIEMTECAASDLSAFDDIWTVFSLPYLWDSGEQAVKTVQDEDVKKVLEESAEKAGFKIIGWTNIGSRSFLNAKRTIQTPADLNGLKIRTMPDKLLADATNAMGAIGTPLGSSEIYTGLQQGTIDGLDHTPAVIAANGWSEICKYFSLTEHFTIPDPIFVSAAWFNTLSPENQEALLRAGHKFSDKWNNEMWVNATENGLEKMKADGIEITKVDKTPFKEAAQGVVNEFLSSASDNQKNLYELLLKTQEKYKQ